MIEVIKYPSSYCFVGNPVQFELKSDNPDTIPYTVKYKDEEVELSAYFYKKKDRFTQSLMSQMF